MAIEEPTHIIVSKSNKEKLDIFKILKNETYNSVLDELIEFGEEYDFKNVRIKNLIKTTDEINGENSIPSQ